MSLYVCNEIADYWNTSGFTPDHPISSYMSRNRSQELHMRVRIHGNGVEGPYDKVSNTDYLLL